MSHHKKFVSVKAKGGRSTVVDMTTPPNDLSRPWPALVELAEHAKQVCCILAHQYDWLGQRAVEIDSLLGYLADRNVPDSRLIQVFDGGILGPLEELYQKLADLTSEAAKTEGRDMREVVRKAVASDEGNFGKMLEVFEKMVEDLLQLNDQDSEARKSATATLKEVDKLVASGTMLKCEISGSRVDDKELLPGLEQELEKLLIQTRRDLTEGKGQLMAKDALEFRWAQLERSLTSLRHAKNRFEAIRVDYDTKVKRFFFELDSVQLYRGEWNRHEKALRHAQEFFRAADIDPFQLSDKLAGISPNQVFTMPDCQVREVIEGSVPEAFPKLDENRIISRAEMVLKDILDAIEELEKAELKPLATQLSQKPLLLPIPLAAFRPSPEPPLPPKQVATMLGKCPVSFMDLAICTWAAFVYRYPSGKVHASSGRTIQRVYANILVPTGLVFDCLPSHFHEAVFQGMKEGFMHCFHKGGNDIYQPTIEGFARAEKLYPLLPADFRQRIREANESIKQADTAFRTEKLAKKKK